MNFKRIVSILSIVCLLCSGVASAEAFRKNYRKEASSVTVTRNRPNDIVFEEFTAAKPGDIPPGIVVNTKNDYGYTSSGLQDIGGGKEKNCMLLVDTNNEVQYIGPAFTVNCPSTTGIVGVEVRYKFIKDEISGAKDWTTLIMMPNGTQGTISRLNISSAAGKHVIVHGASSTEVASTPIAPGDWWVTKFIIDTENKKIDVQSTNETTKEVFKVFDVEYNTATDIKDVTSITLKSEVYSGTWAFDYVRFSKETERLVDDTPEENIERGRPVEKVKGPVSDAVKGRTNIKVDGVYKYTTKDPKVTDKGVLVTAKNIATFFDYAYFMRGGKIIIKTLDAEFEIEKNASSVKKNGKAFNLSAPCVAEGKQVFIPIKDIAEEMGYSCEYNADTNTVEILTGAKDDAAGEEQEVE